MKFKVQQYQTDAVDAVVGVFAGQPNRTAKYTRDLWRRLPKNVVIKTSSRGSLQNS